MRRNLLRKKRKYRSQAGKHQVESEQKILQQDIWKNVLKNGFSEEKFCETAAQRQLHTDWDTISADLSDAGNKEQ